MKKHLAFTLAEVLIVISIIGVIAQMTIPALVQNVQEKVAVTRLKKAYSTLSNAYTLAVQADGTPDNWGLVSLADPGGSENIINKLAPYLKITKNCGRAMGCFPDLTYKTLAKSPYNNYNQITTVAKAQLADGSIFQSQTFGVCDGTSGRLVNTCGSIVVDINGFSNPNQLGVDAFVFYITMTGITAVGGQQDASTLTSFSGNCADNTTASGLGCTAWVIYNENMDYLHCNGLNWSTKTKCN